MPFKLNPIQIKAEALARSDAQVILFRGGTGSGKTVAVTFFILMRAMVTPNSRHACFRATAVEARAKLFEQTFKDVFNMIIDDSAASAAGMTPWDFWRKEGRITADPMVIKFTNGSTIVFDGLDDNARLNRVLGADYATVYVNEASELASFRPIQALRGRLRQKVFQNSGKPLKPKLFIDCNPPSKRHWTFLAFATHEHPGGPSRVRINPLTGQPHKNPEHWAELKMNAEHNVENLAEGYIDNQEYDHKGEQQFVRGEWYDEVDNPLFSGDDIAAARLPPRLPDNCADLTRIEVSIDPAITNHEGSDETGIIVVGVDANQHGYVLEDLSGKYHPHEWAEIGVAAYHRWQADGIVAEKNQGGDMVEATLRTADPNVPVKLIHASRGKEIRAEGASTAYRQRRVHHCGSFPELEGQLLEFETGFNRKKKGYSPDRLDALVHGLNSIMLMKVERRGGSQVRVPNFWQ